jgi:integrase
MAKRWESDSQVTGLCISRGQAYVFRYGLNGRWDRQLKIGDVGEIPLAKARERAMRFRLAVLAGEDPAAMKRERKTDKTLADLYPAFIERWARPRKSKGSCINDDGYFRNHLLKANFGSWRLRDIDQGALWDWHAAHPQPVTANRCLETLSKAMGLAKRWGWLPREHCNPCEGIEHHPEKSRRRYASPDEVDRLLAALREKKAAGGIHFRFACMIQLLMLTGARLNEIMSARWCEVDLVDQVIRPTKHKRDRTEHREVVLGTDALRVVMELRDHEPPGEWLIRGRGKNHLAEHHKPWSRLKADAQVGGLWVHDLRHTFASYLISSGHTLGVIGELLGHASTATTARYSHLMKQERRRAVDQAAVYLSERKPSQSNGLDTISLSADLRHPLSISSARDTESRWLCSEPQDRLNH